MQKVFRKFCQYYINNDKTLEFKKLKKQIENMDEYQNKIQKYLKKLKEKANKLGYDLDFESFCNLLEEYINKKDSFNDEEKKEYLKILMPLSKIHDINLRQELEQYIVVKKVSKNIGGKELENQIDVSKIFKKLCQYYIDVENRVEKNSKVELTNQDKKRLQEIQKIAQKNNINFLSLNKKVICFVKEINRLTKKLGFDSSKESFYKMIEIYLKQKKTMSHQSKVIYLKILLYLSEIYDINLRKILKTSQKNSTKVKQQKEKTKIEDPLDNEELLSNMLAQRYQNGNFDLEKLISTPPIKSHENFFNYNQLISSLAWDLLNTFLEKFKNYAYEDLNAEFTNLIGEEDLNTINNLTQEDIYNIIEDINKKESPKFLCKKYKLTENIQQFIYLTVTEIVNLKQETIGKITLFNLTQETYSLGIYIEGQEKDILYFIVEYIKKCINNNLSYNLKRDNNQIVLYTSLATLKQKIKIVEKIKTDNKKQIANLYEPFPLTSKMNHSFYGIASIGLMNKYNECVITYPEYLNDLAEVAYYRVLAKLVISKITDKKAYNIINDFIILNNVKVAKDKLCTKSLYNNIIFSMIKDLINQYIPLVSNTLNVYIEDKKRNKNITIEFKKSLLYLNNIMNSKPKKEKNIISLTLN